MDVMSGRTTELGTLDIGWVTYSASGSQTLRGFYPFSFKKTEGLLCGKGRT